MSRVEVSRIFFFSLESEICPSQTLPCHRQRPVTMESFTIGDNVEVEKISPLQVAIYGFGKQQTRQNKLEGLEMAKALWSDLP